MFSVRVILLNVYAPKQPTIHGAFNQDGDLFEKKSVKFEAISPEMYLKMRYCFFFYSCVTHQDHSSLSSNLPCMIFSFPLRIALIM